MAELSSPAPLVIAGLLLTLLALVVLMMLMKRQGTGGVNERAYVRSLLLFLTERMTMAEITEEHSRGPSMARVHFRAPSAAFSVLVPVDWIVPDDDPGPLVSIDGEISGRSGAHFYDHPLWNSAKMEKVRFCLEIDSSTDEATRLAHGIHYALTGTRSGHPDIMRTGILKREHLIEGGLERMFARITARARDIITMRMDEERQV